MYEGLDIPGRNDYPRGLTWDYVRHVREHTSMQVLIKGSPMPSAQITSSSIVDRSG